MQALFKKHPLIPVIALEDANQAVSLAWALLDGGVSIIEIIFRTQAAYANFPVFCRIRSGDLYF